VSRIKISRVFIWVACALVVGISLSAGAAWRQEQVNSRVVQQAVNEAAQRTARDVGSAIQLYQYGLRSTRGVVLTSGANLSREVFRRYSESRDFASEFPGALGFGVIRRIPQTEERQFEAEARRDGWPEFSVRRLSPREGDRYVIQYIEPVDLNRAAVGLDIASEDSRREAADAAMRTGTVKLTAPITLVQGPNESSQSFLILLPIYGSSATPALESDRVNSLIGWSYAPLTMKDVFAHIDIDPTAFALTVSDVTNPAAKIQFYSIGTRDVVQKIEALAAVDRQVFGRRWQIELRVSPVFIDRLNLFSPRSVFGIGLATSCLLAIALALFDVGRQRQKHVLAERARLATIVHNSSDPIIGEAIDGHILSWNAAAEKMFGYSEAEARGQLSSDLLIPPERRLENSDILARVGRGEDVATFETIRIARDGTPIDVSVATSAIHDSFGAVVGAATLLRDLRPLRAEQQRQMASAQNLEKQVAERTVELKNINTLLEEVLKAASKISIIATDVDGVISIFNSGAQLMLGYTADEMVGKQTPAILHVAEEIEVRSRELSAQYNEPITGFEVFIYIPKRDGSEIREWTYVRKGGSRILVSLVVTAMRNEAGQIVGYLGMALDVTEQKQSMEQLAAAKRAADAANKAKSEFLAMMSHELRTPMAGVLGMADLLMDSQLSAEQEQILRTQIRSANTLLDLLNDILDFAKIEAGRLEIENFDFDLREIVQDVGATVAPLASERGNTIQIDVAPDLECAFLGDAKRYRQALMNLLGNANKFTEEGRILIKIGQKALGEDRFEISTTVNDTGIGIAPDALEQLFRPFVQEDVSTSRKYGGTGLGLAITKQLIELLGGKMWVDSKKGVGSTFGFVVTFERGNPLKIDKSAFGLRRASLNVSALPVVSLPLKVLLAEDNDTNRTLLVTILSRMGHQVDAVENGALAVERVIRGDYDIVLMDMQMPVLDGPTAARTIRGMARPIADIPIIALTADALSGSAERYLAQGINVVINKPVNWHQLSVEMERLTATLGARPANAIALSQTSAPPENHALVIDEEFIGALVEAVGLEAFAPMIDSFLRSVATYGEQLSARAIDLVAAKKSAHGLKGVAAQFGALRLSELARKIEVEVQTTDEIRSMLPELEKLIAVTIREFQAWREQRLSQ